MTTRQGITIMPNQIYYVACAPTNNQNNFRDGTSEIKKLISQCLRKSFQQYSQLETSKKAFSSSQMQTEPSQKGSALSFIEISSEIQESEVIQNIEENQHKEAERCSPVINGPIILKQSQQLRQNINISLSISTPVEVSEKKIQQILANKSEKLQTNMNMDEEQLQTIGCGLMGSLGHQQILKKKQSLMQRNVDNWEVANKKYRSNKREVRMLNN